jgi:hypothetical protein
VRTSVTGASCLLASSLNKAPIGLLIDGVYGQRHFLTATPCRPSWRTTRRCAAWSASGMLGAETWHELDLDRLFNTAEFLNGSAI